MFPCAFYTNEKKLGDHAMIILAYVAEIYILAYIVEDAYIFPRFFICPKIIQIANKNH